MMLALLLALAVPNPILTPGAIRPLTQIEVCAIRWSVDVRHVTPSMKRDVFARYGISPGEEWRFTIDHLIPRELGGADSPANLWPQPKAEARAKDYTENRAHRDVCKGILDLHVAQEALRTWGR